MATTIPCSIDTSPMAAEIQSVSHHLQGTTAAVITMQGAVIAAENSSANKVCRNVNRGFFTLMQSQISQKIANKQSRVEALLMKLAHQKRLLLGIKNTMEREYGRISERYLKVFTSINKNLEQSVRQLDQPVFEFVTKHMATLSNRMYMLPSWVVLSQNEGVSQSQQVLVSKIKRNAQQALSESTDFLSQIADQCVTTRKVLVSNPYGNENRVCLIPIIVFETISDTSVVSKTNIYMPSNLTPQYVNQIDNTLNEPKSLSWSRGGKPEQVTEEFGKMVDNSNLSTRIKSTIMKMYSTSNFETL